jgi:hypothetical protein
MPYYRVTIRRDAWLNYNGVVDADSPEAAAAAAERALKTGDRPDLFFEEDNLTEFAEILCDPADCEETDELEFKEHNAKKA